jgi:hypothetical protein
MKNVVFRLHYCWSKRNVKSLPMYMSPSHITANEALETES